MTPLAYLAKERGREGEIDAYTEGEREIRRELIAQLLVDLVDNCVGPPFSLKKKK
jgi:hypothetical protein